MPENIALALALGHMPLQQLYNYSMDKSTWWNSIVLKLGELEKCQNVEEREALKADLVAHLNSEPKVMDKKYL